MSKNKKAFESNGCGCAILLLFVCGLLYGSYCLGEKAGYAHGYLQGYKDTNNAKIPEK